MASILYSVGNTTTVYVPLFMFAKGTTSVGQPHYYLLTRNSPYPETLMRRAAEYSQLNGLQP